MQHEDGDKPVHLCFFEVKYAYVCEYQFLVYRQWLTRPISITPSCFPHIFHDTENKPTLIFNEPTKAEVRRSQMYHVKRSGISLRTVEVSTRSNTIYLMAIKNCPSVYTRVVPLDS